MKRLILLVLLLGACSAAPDAEIPPLPEQTADTANRLMVAAEKASRDAAVRTEPAADPKRSVPTTNEVTP